MQKPRARGATGTPFGRPHSLPNRQSSTGCRDQGEIVRSWVATIVPGLTGLIGVLIGLPAVVLGAAVATLGTARSPVPFTSPLVTREWEEPASRSDGVELKKGTGDMLKSLRLIPEILQELKSLNSTLIDIHRRQTEIKEEMQLGFSEVNEIRACLDITVAGLLENISNNSDRASLEPSRPIHYEGPPPGG
jgi:hypothetical protein